MNNIFVGNLSPDATEQDIRSIFEKHGSVDRFRMMTDRETGHPRGFAFVEMTDDSAAEKAIAALNGSELKGRGINVSAARPQLYRHSGNGGSRSKKEVTAVKAVENERGEARTMMTKTVRSRFNHEVGESVEGCKILGKSIVVPPDSVERRRGIYDYLVEVPPISVMACPSREAAPTRDAYTRSTPDEMGGRLIRRIPSR